MPTLALGSVVPLLFFLTGAGTLIIEATWLRWLRSIMGATAPAVSATLVALSLGQFLGALLGALVVRRARLPLVAFGAFQLAVVGCALLVAPAIAIGTQLLLLAHAGGITSGGPLTFVRRAGDDPAERRGRRRPLGHQPPGPVDVVHR